MEDIIPFIVILFVFSGFLKNVLKKLSEIKGGQESGEQPTLTGQLRDLLQGDEDEDSTPSQDGAPMRPSRPSVRPVAQQVERTQPPSPAARPMVQPVNRTQPPRPMAPPRPVISPQPVRPPTPQALARQIKTEAPKPLVEAARPRPIHVRPEVEPARSGATQEARPQGVTSQSEKARLSKTTPKKTDSMPYKRGRRRGQSPKVKLNRRNLGAAMVITEIMNPPLALRGQNMPWDE